MPQQRNEHIEGFRRQPHDIAIAEQLAFVHIEDEIAETKDFVGQSVVRIADRRLKRVDGTLERGIHAVSSRQPGRRPARHGARAPNPRRS